MRAAAVIGVLAGCNSVFGLDPTHVVQIDAATTFRVTLDYMVLPAPGMAPEFHPIPGLHTVKVAGMGEPLEDAPVSDTGEIGVPLRLLNRPYRIVYELPLDPVTHEIMWTGLEGSHYAVPLFGAIDRTPAPAMASISISTSTGIPSSFVAPRMFTTGDQWTASPSLGMNVMQPLAVPYTAASGVPATAPQGGPLGPPTGDTAIWLVDYSATSTPQVLGFTRTSIANMGQGLNLATPQQWSMAGTQVTFAVTNSDTVTDKQDLASALAGHAFASTATFSGGVVASTMMPGPSNAADDAAPDDGVFIPFITSTATNNFTPAIDPFDGALPRAIRNRLASTRTVTLPPSFGDTVTLVSGFQSTFDSTNTAVDNHVGIAKTPLLTDSSQVKHGDLSQADLDPQANTPINGGDAVSFEFTLDKTADLCEVVPYQVNGGLKPLRSIDLVIADATQSQKVTFDPDPFQVGFYYTIRVTCRSGYDAGALQDGHVDAIKYPFRTSTHFVAVFQAVPVQ